MKNEIVNKIYTYDNFRFFLKDYFKEQKKLKEVFSHRYFAKKAGFASSSFCAHVIDGKRGLTVKSLKKMVKGLGLRGRKATYFENLVLYNQAVTVEERENHFKKLDRIRRSTEFYKVKQKQYAYYDKWYYPVIRELAVFGDWNDDYSKLASMVIPSIQPEKARKAVNTLLDIGMLVQKPDGTFDQPNKAVTAENVPTVVTRKVRKKYIHLADEAMENMPVDKRFISGVTVLISDEKYKQVITQLDEIRKNILAESLDESEKDKVYQFNFQAFPLSNIIHNEKKDRSKGEERND